MLRWLPLLLFTCKMLCQVLQEKWGLPGGYHGYEAQFVAILCCLGHVWRMLDALRCVLLESTKQEKKTWTAFKGAKQNDK